MARVTVQGKTASNSLVDLLVEEDGSLAASSGASAAAIGAAVNTLPALSANIDGTIAADDTWELALAANTARQTASIFNTSTESLQVREGASGLGRPLTAGSGGLIETQAAVYVKGTTGQTFNVLEG